MADPVGRDGDSTVDTLVINVRDLLDTAAPGTSPLSGVWCEVHPNSPRA